MEIPVKPSHVFLVGLCLLVAFALFSRAVKRGAMRETDLAVTVKVQERIDTSSRLRLARATGELMEGATFLASPVVSLVGITVITLGGMGGKRRLLTALAIPLAFGLMTLAEIYGKSVIRHPAPPFFLLKNPTTVFPRYYIWEDSSYPSGHAARATFIAIASLFVFPFPFSRKWALLGLGIYTALTSVSRIYLGHHWLSDVVGGWLLGAGSGLLTSAFFLAYNRKRHEGLA